MNPVQPDGDFVPAGSVPGMIFCPREQGVRKHPCADCACCQQCSDARCAVCLAGKRGCADPQKQLDMPPVSP